MPLVAVAVYPYTGPFSHEYDIPSTVCVVVCHLIYAFLVQFTLQYKPKGPICIFSHRTSTGESPQRTVIAQALCEVSSVEKRPRSFTSPAKTMAYDFGHRLLCQTCCTYGNATRMLCVALAGNPCSRVPVERCSDLPFASAGIS